VTKDIIWLKSWDWEYYKSPVSMSYISAKPHYATPDKMYAFAEFNTSAIFDPEVDYMYIN